MDETNETRHISELLRMDTYQGMSDAEIELVIEWRVMQRMNSAEYVAKTNAFTDALNDMYELNSEHLAFSESMLERIANRGVDLGVIEYE